MAKLSARGRTEVYRIEKEGIKQVLMSDRAVLVNFGWGWRFEAKLQPTAMPSDWLAVKLAAGWKVLEGR